jgi:DNA-binding CsgD family transcriptional regulator
MITAREREVLQWIYHGKTYAEIAAVLGISRHTVVSHAEKILRNLDCHTQAQAVGRGVELGIVGASCGG